MRENIGLYRGKRIYNDEWVEGWLVIKKDPVLKITYCFILAYGEGESFITWYPVDPETVGECSGILDRANVFIFEGDILKITYLYYGTGGDGGAGANASAAPAATIPGSGGMGGHGGGGGGGGGGKRDQNEGFCQKPVMAVIKFNNGKFSARYTRNGKEYIDNLTATASSLYKIVGNIYDNPELVKGAADE